LSAYAPILRAIEVPEINKMDLMKAAQNLAKVGALLGIVLGLFSALFWAYVIFSRTGLLLWAINLLDAGMGLMSVIAIFASYFVYSRVSERIVEDAFNNGLVLVGLGILIAIGAWGIAGIVLVISGVLILIEETS
jgi:hypothetical protein